MPAASRSSTSSRSASASCCACTLWWTSTRGNDQRRQVMGPVSMPFIGFFEIDAAYLLSLTVMGPGRDTSPTMIGGRTQREPYDWTHA
eukprot:364685-Chlamydomonas_euryale.AAC.16